MDEVEPKARVQDSPPRRGDIFPNPDVQISRPRYVCQEKDEDQVSRNDIFNLTSTADTLRTHR